MDVQRLALTGPATPVVDRVSSNPVQGSAPLDVTWSGTLVYVEEKMRTPRTLLWLNRAGLTQPFGAASPDDFAFPRFSPDGTRLAVARTVDGNLDVWVYDIGRDTCHADPRLAHSPVWSVGISYSRRKVQARNFSGCGRMAGKPSGGGDSGTHRPVFVLSRRETLAFVKSDPKQVGRLDAALEDVDSDHQTREAQPLVTPFNEGGQCCRWAVAGVSVGQSGRCGYRPAVAGPGKWQISGGGALNIVWSEGTGIFYGRIKGSCS
jgi:hypothetical protein